jgi:hypothetical protein
LFTQELKLEDLKHLRTEPPVPKHLMSGGQLSGGGPASTPGLNGGAEDLRDLIEFSNISYQDVRQLIGKSHVGSRRPMQSSVVDPDPDL